MFKCLSKEFEWSCIPDWTWCSRGKNDQRLRDDLLLYGLPTRTLDWLQGGVAGFRNLHKRSLTPRTKIVRSRVIRRRDPVPQDITSSPSRTTVGRHRATRDTWVWKAKKRELSALQQSVQHCSSQPHIAEQRAKFADTDSAGLNVMRRCERKFRQRIRLRVAKCESGCPRRSKQERLPMLCLSNNHTAVRMRGGGTRIYVKPVAGNAMVFYVDLESSVMDLKNSIFERTGVPVDYQRLVWSVYQLESTRSLSDYNVQPESTIQVLIRLRGGSSPSGEHSCSNVESNTCLVNALQALGAPITTSDVGPFFAMHDGNAMLASHGLVLRHVLKPTLGRFILWRSYGTSVGHFIAFTVGADGIVLYDGQCVRRLTSLESVLSSGGDVMVYQLFSRPVKPDRLTAEQWENIQLNRENALKLHRLRRCESIKPADLLSLYLNRTHALAAIGVNPVLHLSQVHRHARDDFIEFVEASHTYVLHNRFQFPISVSGVWLSW